MARYTGTHRLEKEFKDRGLLPPNCKLLELRMEPASALVARFEVFITNEDLVKVAEAIQAVATAEIEAATAAKGLT